MAKPGLSLRMERDRFGRALTSFARKLAPAVAEKVVRKKALDIVSETVTSLNGAEAGYPNPKRIDTGRYRAAWVLGGQQATGVAVGPTAGGHAGDATGKLEGRGLARRITVTNAVEYGPYVEYGTSRMAPGLHLHRALRVATRDIERVVGKELSAAWNQETYGG